MPVRVTFGDFEFDSGRRVLTRHGRIVPLSPKAFQLLELLLDRRPEAVSKSEFLEHLWPGTFVSDASLHNLVAEVRAALIDTARPPRYIRTFPRWGYAFHGEVGDAPEAGVRAVGPTRPGPCLVAKRRDWVLSEGSNLLGRDRDCAVSISSATVSRHHARIVVMRGQATIEDLGSKNGTYVNGQRLAEPRALEDGDEVRVGSVTMTYRIMEPLPSTLTQGRS